MIVVGPPTINSGIGSIGGSSSSVSGGAGSGADSGSGSGADSGSGSMITGPGS